MEMNILLKAEERLLNVLERLAKAWETSLHTQEPTTTTATATGNIAAPTVTAEKSESVPETPKTTKHLHYGLQPDGVSTYTKWDDMCKALDRARETQGPAKVKELLTAYSENGEYGGVKPANWDKVIKECSINKKEPEPATDAEPAQAADISEEELRTACTMAKNAGVNVPHYLESIAGVKRVTKVPEGLRIKVKEALEAEMGGKA